ncbi:hypothetical protein Bca52824_048147 [Brassica carinata]|uniref:Uncharacterized protein n=1 Tax=Brassica carinata TaxID=52824 RepID=A0A8X7RKD6_BRACI|nr:hypothetical protein Bca52824_048147 [Brassica carinata]
MVARTICGDSVLNHRSKLPWMKRQSNNCQEQLPIYITMNVPPWTNRHNQITTVDMSLRYCCDPCVDGIVESAHRVVLLSLKSEQASSDGAVEDVMLDGAQEALTRREPGSKDNRAPVQSNLLSATMEWNSTEARKQRQRDRRDSVLKSRGGGEKVKLVSFAEINSRALLQSF